MEGETRWTDVAFCCSVLPVSIAFVACAAVGLLGSVAFEVTIFLPLFLVLFVCFCWLLGVTGLLLAIICLGLREAGRKTQALIAAILGAFDIGGGLYLLCGLSSWEGFQDNPTGQRIR